MRRNFIDQIVLDDAITRQLAHLPPPLVPYSLKISALLRRHLPELPIGVRTLPAMSDPGWVHERAAEGKVLYRLGAEGKLTSRQLISGLLFDIERLLLISEDVRHPYQALAWRHLRGMSHWHLEEIEDDGWGNDDASQTLSERLGLADFLCRAGQAAEQQGHDLPFTTPVRLRAGKLVGTRATTLSEVTRIGQEACNCLSSHRTARRTISQDRDIWALRSKSELIAVLEVTVEGVVEQLKGPDNTDRFTDHLADIVLFCRRAGFRVSWRVDVKLADLMPPELRVTTRQEEEADQFSRMISRIRAA